MYLDDVRIGHCGLGSCGLGDCVNWVPADLDIGREGYHETEMLQDLELDDMRFGYSKT